MEHRPSLGGRAVNAVRWQVVAAAYRAALQFAATVVLARLLLPTDFGVVTFALIFVDFTSSLLQLGLAQAVIQRSELTIQHIRVAWTGSLVTGLAGTGFVWVLADRLVPQAHADVLRALSFTFLITSIGAVSSALLTRDLNFRAHFVVDALSGSGYLATATALALLGFGPWSLAIGLLLQSASRTGILLGYKPHSLKLSLRIQPLRELLSFGLGMTLVRVANLTARNADYFVVGRALGVRALGLYSRAYVLATMTASYISTFLNSVMFPIYAKVQKEQSHLKRGFLVATRLAVLISAPPMAMLAVLPGEVLAVLFGDRWAEASRALQILTIAGVGRPIYGVTDALVRGTGRVYSQFVRHSIYAALVFAAAVVGTRFGIAGIAVGVAVSVMLMDLMMVRLSLNICNASWSDFARAVAPGILVALSVFGGSGVASHILRQQALSQLIVLLGGVTAGLIAGLAAFRGLPKNLTTDLRQVLQQHGNTILPDRVLRSVGRVLGFGDLTASENLAQQI